jgi:hypothetical protein
MHLAIVGICPLSRDLVLAAISLGHRITWYLPAEGQAEAALGPGDVGGEQVTCVSHELWESLLDSPTVDAVVLAEATTQEIDLRSDQWRRLTQAGTRILFIHPLVPSLLVYLEVDMLARESSAALVPYWPDAHSEPVRGLGTMSAGADYGIGFPKYEHVSYRRLLKDRSPQEVTKWFARDAALLDLVAGPFTEISAIGPDTSDAAYASLAVHLHGPAGVPVRWEVARAQTTEQATMSAIGQEGERQITLGPPQADGPGASVGGSAEALAGIASFATNRQLTSRPLEDWQRSVRAMELADSIELSLRRGRRIDVYYRQLTEETSYKGMMSAVGCGLLLFAPMVLVVAGVINAVFGWRLTKFWYLPVLAIFVGFLLLQLVARIMARRPEPLDDDDAR